MPHESFKGRLVESDFLEYGGSDAESTLLGSKQLREWADLTLELAERPQVRLAFVGILCYLLGFVSGNLT